MLWIVKWNRKTVSLNPNTSLKYDILLQKALKYLSFKNQKNPFLLDHLECHVLFEWSLKLSFFSGPLPGWRNQTEQKHMEFPGRLWKRFTRQWLSPLWPPIVLGWSRTGMVTIKPKSQRLFFYYGYVPFCRKKSRCWFICHENGQQIVGRVKVSISPTCLLAAFAFTNYFISSTFNRNITTKSSIGQQLDFTTNFCVEKSSINLLA